MLASGIHSGGSFAWAFPWLARVCLFYGNRSTIPNQTSCLYSVHFGACPSANREYRKIRNVVDCMRGCLVPCCVALQQSQSRLLRAQSGWEYSLMPVHDSKSYHVEGKAGKNTTTMAVNRRPVRPLECLSRVECGHTSSIHGHHAHMQVALVGLFVHENHCQHMSVKVKGTSVARFLSMSFTSRSTIVGLLRGVSGDFSR